MMAVVKLVTLDVTNTVVRVLGSVGQQYSAIAKIYGLEVAPQAINSAFKVKWKEQNNNFPNFGNKSGMTSYQWWGDLVQKTFVHAGLDPSNMMLDSVAGHLYKHFTTSNGWELIPNAVPVLQELKSKKIIVGAISNFDERLETVLRTLAILHYFDFVISSKQLGIAKPEPEIFYKALELANVPPVNSVHIGDDIENDYQGAKNVGMKGLLYWSKKSEIPSNITKDDCLFELKDILKYLQNEK